MRITLIVPAKVESFQNVRARVYAERARYADRRAELVTELFLGGLSHTAGTETRTNCALDLSQVTDWKNIILRAHIDVDGDGNVSAGDLLSQRSYPVTSDSQNSDVTVEYVGRKS